MTDDMYEQAMDEWNEKVVGSGGPLDPEQVYESSMPESLDDVDGVVLRHGSGSLIEWIQEIAAVFGVSVPDVIQTSFENTSDDNLMPTLHRDKGVLQYLAEETELDNGEMAECLNVTSETIRKWLDKHELDNWCVEKWGDSVSWTRQSRKVRELDGNECVVCGRTQSENTSKYGDKLHVHHIVPKRLVEADENKHAVENLVSLCSECHREYEQLTPRALFRRAVDD
jgi:5-methylcytosine-specific restriction endonuclease McrA